DRTCNRKSAATDDRRQGSEDLHRRKILPGNGREGFRLRPWTSLWRRNLRRHSILQRPRVPPRRTPRTTLGFSAVDLPENPDDAAGNDRSIDRDDSAESFTRRLHTAARDSWGRQSGLEPGAV